MVREVESEKMPEQKSEENNLEWGSAKSKSAPSVQEMVSIDSRGVPQRYIRNEEDRPRACPVSEDIPVINISLLASGDEDERKKLHYACKDWGFFQIINHGIEDRVLLNIKAAADNFYELPLAEKKKYAMGENDFQGYGQGYVFDDEQKLDWNDSILMMTVPTKYRNMKFWPTELPNFLNSVEEYSREVDRVSIEIFANLSLLMGMERDALKEMHMVISQGMRLNYYPPCARPDLVIGVSPHSDIGSITFLLQDDDVTGLQIKHKEGWVPVTPVPNAIVVNVGDAMEAWSNGLYRSIDHRAVTNQKRARKSVATFVLPQEEAMLGPVETMVDDSHPRKYKNIKYIDYTRYTMSRKLEGKANTDFLKVENE